MAADWRPGRRTQGERSAATRKKLLAATFETLVERGYAATSAPEVCERAGMSRGALLHHFPTKADLVVEAVRQQTAQRGVELHQLGRSDAFTGDPVARVCDFTWAAFADETFHAALELWVAARCDSELLAALVPMERETARGLADLWHELPGDCPPSDTAAGALFDDLVALTLHLVRGMALQRTLRPDHGERERLFAIWKSMAARELTLLSEVTPQGAARHGQNE